jgi:tetratricopeptide (TPR) repeat protein
MPESIEGTETSMLSAVRLRPTSTLRDALEKLRPGLWLALTVLTVFAVYLPSLAGEFVWDDVSLLSAVERTLNRGTLGNVFVQPFWSRDELDIATRNFYRPLTTLSYALDSLLHQKNAAGFRLTNLVLHLINTCLLFQLSQRYRKPAWLSALLVSGWALQPRLTENVAWISGRTDVLCATFVLAALLLWQPNPLRRIGAAALLLPGLLAKETALVGVVVLALFELFHTSVPLRQRLRWLSVPGFVTVTYLALRAVAMHGQPADTDSLAVLERPAVALEAFANYAWMIFNPWQPRTQIGDISSPKYTLVVLGATLVIVLVVVSLRHRRRFTKETVPWFTLFIVPLLLASHIVPIALSVVAADRFLYLPTMGLVLLTVRLERCLRPTYAFPLFVWVLSLVPVTLRRAPDWSDPLALWTKACTEASSRNSISLLELGNLEYNAGNFDRAYAVYSASIRSSRQRVNERAVTNRAITAFALGRYREAQDQLGKVVARHPTIPKFWYDLATAELRNGEFAAAKRSLATALELMPDYALARQVLDNLGELEQRYRVSSTATLSITERALLRSQLGLFHEAEEDWQQVLESTLAPTDSIQATALLFFVNHGSSASVTRILSYHPTYKQHYPELFAALLDKHQTAKRLERYSLSVYQVTPSSR